MKPVTIGLIVGNRGFFPSHLCDPGAPTCSKCWKRRASMSSPSRRKTRASAASRPGRSRKCAELFESIARRSTAFSSRCPTSVTSAAWPMRCAGRAGRAGAGARVSRRPREDDHQGPPRQLLRQDVGLQQPEPVRHRLLLTTQHTVDPKSIEFRQDLHDFAATCRVVRGLKGLRIGAIGARPAAFNTVRFSEKLLESRHLRGDPRPVRGLRPGRCLADDDAIVKAKLAESRTTSRRPMCRRTPCSRWRNSGWWWTTG